MAGTTKSYQEMKARIDALETTVNRQREILLTDNKRLDELYSLLGGTLARVRQARAEKEEAHREERRRLASAANKRAAENSYTERMQLKARQEAEFELIRGLNDEARRLGWKQRDDGIIYDRNGQKVSNSECQRVTRYPQIGEPSQPLPEPMEPVQSADSTYDPHGDKAT